MTKLADKTCIPCQGGVPPLAGAELERFVAQLGEGWRVVNGHHLERELGFPNFRDALAFASRVGALAEEQNHHPDLHVAWGKVNVEIWTHKIDGLTESDFIFAAKVDRL